MFAHGYLGRLTSATMTPERFGELLRRPTLLSSQNATELEELIAQYPWCGALKQLRYQKAILDGEQTELERWRLRAEPYLTGAYRETREASLRNANPAKAAQHFGFQPLEDEAEISTATPESEEDETQTGDDDVDNLLLAVAATSVDTVDWYLHRHGLIMEYGRPKPAPKEAFQSYSEYKSRRAQTAWLDLLRLADEQPKSAKSRKGKAKILPPQPEVASETLADLLAAQGHADKAIRMYKQLALRYPTKEATFTARIEALQQQEA